MTRQRRGLASFIDFSSFVAHPSALVTTSAVIYILHILFQGKIAPLELCAFWSLFLLGWAIARGDASFSWHILYFPLIVYGVVSTTSAAMADRRIHQLFEGILWFKMVIFPCGVILFRTLPRMRELTVYAHATFVTILSSWGLFEFFFQDRRDLEHRIDGPSTHVMTFSGLILPISLMLLVLWFYERKWWQLTAGSLATLTLLLTFTRSVWLGWIVAAFVVLLASRARLVFYALPVLILFVTFLPMNLFSRLVSTFDMKQESNFDRIRMLEAGVEMIHDFPLLGVGPANVKEVYSIYRKQDSPRARPPHLHNNVVQLWAERGILGLGAYILLLGLFLRECLRGRHGPNRKWSDVGVVVVVSLTVAGLFEFNFGDTEVFYLLLNLFALVVVSLEQSPPEANATVAELVPAGT
ncbi:MAG: O-antigen ligase family protein [Acidobacteriota bacterium]|nr:O-antigen ligase family protein [Acidobacteriota bacterium]